MTVRTLITGVHVVSMDPLIGDLPIGDVLVSDGEIVRVAPAIDLDDACEVEVVDATGHIVLPGLIDTHRHTWQSSSAASVRTGPSATTTSASGSGCPPP